MEKQPRKLRGTAVLFGLVISAFGLPLGAQTATLSLENDRYAVGQRFTLEILVEGGDANLRVVEPTYPENLVLISPPFVQTAAWDSGGRTITGVKAGLSFRVVKPGIISLGPFDVVQGARRITAGTKTLFLLAPDEAQNKFPLEIKWVFPAGPYFQGQAIPLQLQVRNMDSIVRPQEVSITAPGDSILEKVLGGGEIEIGSIGDQRFFHIPWGNWMLIPSSSGTLVLPGFSIAVKDLTRWTPELRLDVQKVPEEVGATRAVGEFSYDISADQGTGDRAGEILIKQELRGTGNFPYLVLPKLVYPGLRLINRQESPTYRASSDGYQGNLTVNWRFAPLQTGNLDLNLPGFVWFSPQSQKVLSLDEKKVSFTITSLPSVDKKKEELTFLTWDQIQAVRSWDLLESWWSWLFLLPGLIYWAFQVLFKKKKGRQALLTGMLSLPLFFSATNGADLISQAQAAADRKDFPEALKAMDAYLEVNPREPGVWYNKGVAYFSTDQNARAIHAFRTAIAQGFQGVQATDALALAEERENLPDQIHPWQGVSTDVLWLIFLLGFNGFLCFWALAVRARRGGWVIFGSLFLLVALAGAGTALYTQNLKHQTGAILGPADSPIHRVPGELAEDWMVLKRGTSLRVLGKTGDFYLVQTGYGLEGWVHTSCLIMIH